MNIRWHRRKQQEELLRKRLRGSLTITVDSDKMAELIQLMKARGIISSRRDLGRRVGLASTTIDAIVNSDGEVDSKISTIEAISQFALRKMPDLYGTDAGDKLLDDLLGEDAPLRRDLKAALRGQ